MRKLSLDLMVGLGASWSVLERLGASRIKLLSGAHDNAERWQASTSYLEEVEKKNSRGVARLP